MALAFPESLRHTWLDAVTTQAGTSCLIRIYSGTRVATGAALSGNTLLAELTGDATAFAAAASGGVLTANDIDNDASADATGTAAWFRVVQSDGTTFVMDGDVGTSGADLNMNTVSIVAGSPVFITSFAITAPNA